MLNCSWLKLCVLTAGAAGPRLFTIHQIDANTNNLPKAHTWCVTNAPADTIFIMRMEKPYHIFTHVNSLSPPQLQSDWHSALRELRQALRQAADGDRGDLRLRSGMRDTSESVFVCEHVLLCAGLLKDYYRDCDVPTGSLRDWYEPSTSLQSSSSLTALHILPISKSVWTAARESSCYRFSIHFYVLVFFKIYFGVVCVK